MTTSAPSSTHGSAARSAGTLSLTIDGIRRDFRPTGALLVGRDATAEVVVANPQVSRRHLELRPEGDTWIATDLGSGNGTWINGHRISQPVRLDGSFDVFLGGVAGTGTLVRLGHTPTAGTVLAPAAPLRPGHRSGPRLAVAAMVVMALVAGFGAAAGTRISAAMSAAQPRSTVKVVIEQPAGSSATTTTAPPATPPKQSSMPTATSRLDVPAQPAGKGASGPGSGLYGGKAAQGTMEDFLTAVLTDVDAYWTDIFRKAGLPEPQVNYEWESAGHPVATSCTESGMTDDQTAAYCPPDDRIDVAVPMAQAVWKGQIRANHDDTRGRTSGDFSVAFLVAHEYAHSLQQELGILGSNGVRRYPVIATELHADCWAGIWANSAYWAGSLDSGDVQEAIDAAAMVGDYDFGAADHHGTPAQRVAAFSAGYNSGVPIDCDRFLATPAAG